MPILQPKQLTERYQQLKSSRSNWETNWQESADYHMPNKATVNVRRTSGDKRGIMLLDNTGMVSLQQLAGSLQSFVTNPSVHFFKLATGDDELNRQDDIRKWLQDSTERMHNVLNNSNFHTEVHETYLNLCLFGTAPLFILEDDEEVVRFGAKVINDLVIAEDSKHRINQVFRMFEFNAAQLVEEFGEENVGRDVHQCWKKGDNKKFKVYHGVYPDDVSGSGKWISQHILDDGSIQLRIAAFNEFPFVVPRWTKMPEEIYGRSPAMTSLPEMKTLNKMMEITLRGAQKVIDPPLQAEDDGSPLQIRTRPGGINYRRPGSAPITPIFNDSRVDFGFQILEEGRKRVRQAFFVDQLNLQQGPQMTATEVNARLQEAARLMGPVIGRLQSEFLDPLIDRVFNIMQRRGLFLDAPDILAEKDLDIQFTSLVFQAQRASVINNTLEFGNALAPFAQADPSILDLINGDGLVRVLHNGIGAPEEILRDVAEVEGIRDARQQAQEEAIQQQQEAAQSANMKDQAQALKAVR